MWVTFSNKPSELIHLHAVTWVQVWLYNTNISICAKLNGFMFCYLLFKNMVSSILKKHEYFYLILICLHTCSTIMGIHVYIYIYIYINIFVWSRRVFVSGWPNTESYLWHLLLASNCLERLFCRFWREDHTKSCSHVKLWDRKKRRRTWVS